MSPRLTSETSRFHGQVQFFMKSVSHQEDHFLGCRRFSRRLVSPEEDRTFRADTAGKVFQVRNNPQSPRNLRDERRGVGADRRRPRSRTRGSAVTDPSAIVRDLDFEWAVKRDPTSGHLPKALPLAKSQRCSPVGSDDLAGFPEGFPKQTAAPPVGGKVLQKLCSTGGVPRQEGVTPGKGTPRGRRGVASGRSPH